MKAKHYYEDGNITLSVNTDELVIIRMGIKEELKKQNDYLAFFKKECNAELEIQKCNTKIEKLESMLSVLQY